MKMPETTYKNNTFCRGCKCNMCTHPKGCHGNHYKGVPDCFTDVCKNFKLMKK